MVEVHLLEPVLRLRDPSLKPRSWLAGDVVSHGLLALQLPDPLHRLKLVLRIAQCRVIRSDLCLDHWRRNEPRSLLFSMPLVLLLLVFLIISLFVTFSLSAFQFLINRSD